MEVPPGFCTVQSIEKMCKMKKSMYGLKQSSRAWFKRFRKTVTCMGYSQTNADHTVFFRHARCHVTILAVYIDDIVITDDEDEEIVQLKSKLAKELEVKDLGVMRYFLGVKVA